MISVVQHDKNNNSNKSSLNSSIPVSGEAILSVANYGVLRSDTPIIECGNELPENEKTTYIETLMNLLNGMIGSGVLSMPWAFYDGGLIVSLIVTPLIGLLSCYCIHLLLNVNRLAMKTTGKPPFDYHEIAEYAFILGPQRLKKYHLTVRRLVIGIIFSTQLGACCVYYVFIATMLQTFLKNCFGNDAAPTQKTCMLLVLPILILTMWIRNYRHLARLSTVTNFFQAFGVISIIYNFFSIPIQNPSRLPTIGKKIPQFFVSTLFIYEGSSVSMSLYRAMKKERHFRMPLGVLNIGIFLIIIFYTAIGALGYIQYGQNTRETITDSLPATPLYDTVQLAYAFVVLGTYPVILYVPIQVIWEWCQKQLCTKYSWKEEHKSNLIIGELALRTCIVLLTFSFAIVVPKVELILSLVGSITSSSVAIIIPSIIHTVIFWPRCSSFFSLFWLVATNLVIFIIGLSAFSIGFYYSIQDINSYLHS